MLDRSWPSLVGRGGFGVAGWCARVAIVGALAGRPGNTPTSRTGTPSTTAFRPPRRSAEPAARDQSGEEERQGEECRSDCPPPEERKDGGEQQTQARSADEQDSRGGPRRMVDRALQALQAL